MNYAELRAKRNKIYQETMLPIMDKMDAGNETMTTADRAEFDKAAAVIEDIDVALRAAGGDPLAGMATTISPETAERAKANRALIGRDTHDLPEPGDGKPLEARHDLTAYLSQRKDFNPTKMDFGSFDRDAFWVQLITGNKEGREYRALQEGAQSATFTNAGVLVPIGFSASVLELLRANLMFTSPGLDGAINGPMVMDMDRQIEYVPVWATDAAGLTTYVGENPTLTPGTAALGSQILQARTMGSIQLASRQLIDDNATTGGIASLIESNMAAGLARGMDTAAIYGTGTPQPSGLFTATYSGTLLNVSMGTNGALFVPGTTTGGQFGPFSQAIEKVRMANDNPTGIYTNPQVAGSAARGLSTLNTYIEPSADVAPYWPPQQSTAFTATETQGTGTTCSSALVANANRIILGWRQGLVLSTLTERYADALQYGFLSYLRHDWAFPYSQAMCRISGILTT
ncbi:MAG TPA: phage major capsid protein [Streptosporangiaceae bacterium]|jgi:HK97 family phage major capsid protein|nr:phage major capsid protein [Streptosporangiaceae bacterium]